MNNSVSDQGLLNAETNLRRYLLSNIKLFKWSMWLFGFAFVNGLVVFYLIFSQISTLLFIVMALLFVGAFITSLGIFRNGISITKHRLVKLNKGEISEPLDASKTGLN